MSAMVSLRLIPKVELHLHLETSLRLRRLAEYDHPDRRAYSEPHLIADPGAFTGYDRLRRLRYAGRAGRIPDEVYTAENITRITGDLLTAAAAQNVRYVEVRVGGRRGFAALGVRGMLEAMARAAEDAERRNGIRSGFLVTLVRERGPEEAEAIVGEAAACRDLRVVGIDLAGDEANYPPAMFMRAVERARQAGLGITVHAGEFTGPTSIWIAIHQLGAQRIGHGIRAVEDPELLTYLRDHRVTLEICPSSNIRLGLAPSVAEHPLRALLAAGVPVTVNSDDPVLLDTDITRELASVQGTLGLSAEEITTLIRAAARAAFLPQAVRRALEDEVTQAPAAS
ncbi:MAG: adenosine deaminase [Armatimonadetes bacterium]|nr:adenosine deaminase [Armatimonadota bacterium]